LAPPMATAASPVGTTTTDGAFADYDQAIRFDPKNAIAYLGRGNVYGNRGEYARAIADYDQTSRFEPKKCCRLQ
jgi:tetratricopeptide (TPR) repeat protein